MKDLNYYLALPYPIEIVPDEGGYVATVPDLPGCASYGKNLEEAFRGLDEAKALWLEGRFEASEEIPEPTSIEEFSGKFVLRIPRSLHRMLDREARKQGVSLNQHVLHILAERHLLVALHDKVETIFDRLAALRLRENEAWSNAHSHSHYRATRKPRLGGPGHVNLENLGIVPRPPRSCRMRLNSIEDREPAHAHP